MFDTALSTNGYPNQSAVTADFNGDGIPDIASVYSNQITVELGNGDGTFQPPLFYYTLLGSDVMLATADFNGDGKPDLAVITGGSSTTTISILIGNGNGTFQPQVDYMLHLAASNDVFVVAADLNGDGKPDLALADYGNTGEVSVLLNNGDGTFGATSNFPSGVVTNYPTGTDTNGNAEKPFALAVGDFNGDGYPDLAVEDQVAGNCNGCGGAVSYNNVQILLNNGAGKFTLSPNIAITVNPRAYFGGFTTSSIAAADFNQDGKQDLVLSDSNDQIVVVALGNGDGTFASSVNYSVGLPVEGDLDYVYGYVQGVTVADMNGDGIPDLLTTNGNSNGPNSPGLSLLIGNGDGTFQSALLSDLPGQQFNVPYSYGVGDNAGVAVVGDFNEDGKADVVVGASSALYLLLGNSTEFSIAGTTQFLTAGSYATATGASSDYVTLGDFNGDGIPDMAVSEGNNLDILLGNGDGTFGTKNNTVNPMSYPFSSAPSRIVSGDFNGDGKLDLAVLLPNGDAVDLMLGNGDGTFNYGVTLSLPTGTVFNDLAIGQFFGTGNLDLAVSVANVPGIVLYPGNGKGSFGTPTTVGASINGTSATYIQLGAADVNGDGKLDLVAISPSVIHPQVYVLLGQGGGAFAAPIPVNGAPLESINFFAIGDFNGDGKPDLALAEGMSSGGNEVTSADAEVVLGNGDGTFGAAVSSFNIGGISGGNTGNNLYVLNVADVNGDGKLDLIAANETPNVVSVLLGDGTGNFATRSTFVGGESPNAVAIGDLNGDGFPDLVTANAGGNFISVSIQHKPLLPGPFNPNP